MECISEYAFPVYHENDGMFVQSCKTLTPIISLPIAFCVAVVCVPIVPIIIIFNCYYSCKIEPYSETGV